jgi:hypothetical protein
MKSTKQLSSLIRAKKKKMKEDPDVIDSGDSPKEDLQDLEIERQQETTDKMDHNDPVERNEGLDESNASEHREEEQEQSNHKDERADKRDDEKELLRNVRRDRARKIISRD